MGLSNISPASLLIIFLVAAFFLGGKRLSNLGSDLAKAFKGFRREIQDDEPKGSK